MRLRADVSTTDTGEGMVVLDERAGRYWQLNQTGALVLRLLLDGVAPHQIARVLAERHAVRIERAAADVTTFLAQLRTAGLVTDHPRGRS
ncbi:MAG: lasso peptide biosynthesis PqqD family chaperone [Pseudonocardiales bacterium]|nr:lasso peptide biosynthesis PqqD family chaperone [Pseudonocardiales bacterium]